ncbi:MAG: tetratricopeptide repeat protein [Acidobacteriota bacterium]
MTHTGLMRRSAYVGCALALSLGCGTAPQTTGAVRTNDEGKIPITTRSDEARALFLRGRVLNENLQTHEAHALFLQAVAIDPAFAFGEYSLAVTSPTAKELAEHLESAVTLAATASAGERLLIQGLQARQRGDPEGARRIAEALVAQYPQDERAHWTLANACSAQQSYERAIAEFKAAIVINPRYSLAYNQMGYAYRSAGQMANAEAAFKTYIALMPYDPNPYDSYAELLMKAGRFEESIAQYRKAQAIDAHFAGAFVGIVANEMLASRHEAAAAEAERYLTVARDDGERRSALLSLAMVHIDRGATDEALRAMERRLALASAIGDTVNMAGDGVLIADILLEAGRSDAARLRWTQAHELLATSSVSADVKQDDALARHYDAARTALAKGEGEAARAEAVAYAAGAAARHHDARIRQAHELNGLVALSARRFADSLAELALADQQNPAVWAAKARAYAGLGDTAKAQELTAQARDMNILPTLPYVFTRAALAAATRSATSGSADGRPR